MIFQCQDCDRKLKVPDSAVGKKVRCPSCNAVIPVGGGSEAFSTLTESTSAGRSRRPPTNKRLSTEFDEDDDYSGGAGGSYDHGDNYEADPYAAPRRSGDSRSHGTRTSSRSGSPEALRSVGLGLLFYGGSLAALIGMGLLALLGGFIGALMNSPILPALGLIGFLVALLLFALGAIIGQTMCILTPDPGARGFIIGSLVFWGISFFCNLASHPMAVGMGSPVIGLAGSIAWIASSVLFMLFIRSTARYAGLDKHARSATILLVAVPTSIVVLIGMVATIGLVGAGQGGLMNVGLLVGGLGVLVGTVVVVFWVMFVSLLIRLGLDLRNS